MVLWKWVWMVLVWCSLGGSIVRAQIASTGVLADPEAPSPEALGESTGFGHALAWAGPRMVIGAPRSYWQGERGGAVWSWNPSTGELDVAPVPGVRDWSSLGWCLDVQALDPGVAVGAPGEVLQGVASGAVHLFQVRDTGLHWRQRVEPPSLESNIGFGHALRWHGGELWIAAPYASGVGGMQEGYLARYVEGAAGFEFSELHGAPIPQAGARFGEALEVTERELFVSSPGQQGGGAVFVLQPNGLTLSASQILRPHGFGIPNAGFGSSLALNRTENVLAVGAPWIGDGMVFLYSRSPTGQWQIVRWLSPPAGSGAQQFGGHIRFDGDGLWVSAPGGAGQVFCTADWRNKCGMLLFTSGRDGVGLGKDFLIGSEGICIGAPGHGQATFADAVKASIEIEEAARLEFHDLGQGIRVQSVAHGSPQRGVVALEVMGVPSASCVELRIWDPSEKGIWHTLDLGRADALGMWKWSGVLPKLGVGSWELELDLGFGPSHPFAIQKPASK